MTQKNTLAIIAVLAAILSVSTFSIVLNSAKVQAQEGQTFSASLSGKDEVPPTESNSTGTAKFQVDENSSQISYWVNVTGIKKINQAHIHNGTEGQNGDIVVTLSKSKSAKGNESPPNLGFSGNITKDDLQGPLKGKEISDLVKLMSDGGAYANVHTDKYPKGAIRGQISSTSGSTEADASANTTTASGNTEADTSANTTTASGNTEDGKTTADHSTSEHQSTDSPDMDVDESMR